MHDSAPNIEEWFRCSLLIYEWWGILQVSRRLEMFRKPSAGGGGMEIDCLFSCFVRIHHSLPNCWLP